MLRFNSIAPVTALGAWLLSAASVCSAVNVPTQPVAPVREVSETLHGVTLKDPYRHLEQVRSPESQAWYQAQGEYTRAQLDKITIRDDLERRITELTSAAGDAVYGITRMSGDTFFYLKRPKGERQFKLVMRVGLTGVERILVDPEVDAKRTGVPHAINYYRPSWDSKYIAYGLSAGGSEDASLHILDVASAKDIGQTFPRVHEGMVGWLPDSRSLTFNQLKAPTPGESDTETYLDSRVVWHTVGQAADAAKAIFGPTATPDLGLARLDVGSITFAPGSPWMIARTTDTTLPEGFLFIARVADLGKASFRWTKISGYEDKITEIELRGNDLYFMTHANAPRKRVLKLDLRKPELANAKEVVASPGNGVLQEFSLSRDAVFAAVRQGTEIILRRYTDEKPEGEDIATPFKGAAKLSKDTAHAYTDILYTISGWTQMPVAYIFNGKQTVDSGLIVNPVLQGLPEVEVLNVEVPSHDGALVPMTLLYKKGLQRDGNNPTLLTAYAAYGFSETAGFSAQRMAWIERGGVIALANVRGSGVHGHPWYRAGQKATKPNTWKDGVACAEYLIAQGYARPETLAAMGTSAGGIFVGRTVTTAPQLFAAAIFDVGVMDTVRAEDSANGITNISEFGSSANPKEFPALLEMSTYHQIKDGTPYPAILLVHGMNDPRVDVWHSGKAAARLQAATSSKKPILLRLDMQAGHGMGSTATQRNAMSADIYAFLLWQMGKVSLKEPPPQLSQADIIKNSAPSDWRKLSAENTLVMEINGQSVIMELAPRFAPKHAANIRTLAREGYYTGSAIVRVQDNYVTQWADPADEEKEKDKVKPLGTALVNLPAEFSILYKGLPLTPFSDPDGWAPVSGFVDGMPVAANPATNQAWLAHCYGMVGAARSTKPDSSNGTSLYAINGQAPRALDMNITVVGRIVKGMEVLSSMPRGAGAMGFYDKPEAYISITRARMLADIPAAEQPNFEVMRTDTATWRSLVEASRHAIGGWAVRSALHSNICNRSVPTRPVL